MHIGGKRPYQQSKWYRWHKLLEWSKNLNFKFKDFYYEKKFHAHIFKKCNNQPITGFLMKCPLSYSIYTINTDTIWWVASYLGGGLLMG